MAGLLLSISTWPNHRGFMDRNTNYNLYLHLNPKPNHIRFADTIYIILATSLTLQSNVRQVSCIFAYLHNRSQPGSQYQLGTKSSV